LILVLGAAAVAVILFLVLRPSDGDETATETAAATETTPTATTRPTVSRAQIITVDVENGKPVGGVATATVKQGKRVALVVHSDVADEVHLHGYDLHRDVAAGDTATIAFTANIAGRFEAELENRKEQILSLTVEP
jgi:hypothetical protein